MVLSLMQIAVHQFKVTRDRHLDEIVHSGREWAVFQRKDILIITDEEYHLLYASESAEHLFPGMFIGEHGKPSAKVVELMKKEGPSSALYQGNGRPQDYSSSFERSNEDSDYR